MAYENETSTQVNEETKVFEEPSSEEHVLAGFWMRLWAYLIDLLVVTSLNGIVLTPALAFTDLSEWGWGIYTLGGLLTAVISFGYFTVMTKVYRQTIGKMIIGVKVLSEKKELTWRDVIIREVFGRYIHQSIFITNILYLIVAFHPLKKGLHDYFADTFVVLEPRKKHAVKTENI
ncbi:RDD family protein [Bacillus shivajii]|uniref:RDD family protein n=1 Tax=Bacillus shivajii TaxID=1983719 RepID=UPI001CFB6640|nr:RDD family protein [Bacillus shivajii]UCZ52286.1 RDD family protein [Bacillus shivajii]